MNKQLSLGKYFYLDKFCCWACVGPVEIKLIFWWHFNRVLFIWFLSTSFFHIHFYFYFFWEGKKHILASSQGTRNLKSFSSWEIKRDPWDSSLLAISVGLWVTFSVSPLMGVCRVQTLPAWSSWVSSLSYRYCHKHIFHTVCSKTKSTKWHGRESSMSEVPLLKGHAD